MSGTPPGKQTSSSSSNQISRPVQRHLINVYLVLAAMLGLAAFGSTTGQPFGGNGVLETGVTIGSAMGVMTLRRGNMLRWALLATYSLFSGMSLSALVTQFLYLDPSGTLLLGVLSAAMFIFLGLSASATLANRRSMLYVGGMVGSLLALLAWTGLANLFLLRSPALFSAELYLGLIAFSGYVVYDTQMIVERASAGIMDIPGHAMDLFMDLFALFVRLAVILLERESQNQRGRRRGRRRDDDDDDDDSRNYSRRWRPSSSRRSRF
ncbi:inhibitor of apoptosis-promoting Bax1-domain-containing protein [Zychaea mexicana]|uniref:inhibitor of apoptosis-promoting Bax1-domain-containing protein n=1 Tax=Zychaea mexicana TaxID=64656 RepID=UPI0022FDC27E|nr:inhibitor of apoptosis-promoting Bax1-domain-containing protein [Zychaea mexicana]KAI9496825.1 inhibitor of apoptosis-promoting Bax1-domain-containing protein [Zychaea mexicana]